MTTWYRTGTITSFLVLLIFAVAPLAHGATRHVSNTGTDGPSCGVTSPSACRSITQAIDLAAPGDTILVGPGRYGDLNGNGVLGEPGEELGYLTPPASCSCVLRIEKPVIVISRGGAAVTMIDGRSVNVVQNVFLTTVGGEFGRPGKGFTVTGPANANGHGIVLDAGDVWLVRGNQVIQFADDRGGFGILTLNAAAVRIEGNLVSNWRRGIEVRVAGAATVSKNQIIGTVVGIFANGGNIVGNVVTANDVGIFLTGTATAVGNAAYGNSGEPNASAFNIGAPFSGVVTKNNMFANSSSGSCAANTGLVNSGVGGLNATNNYWGAPTGPGALPANDVCNLGGGTTTTSPFATKPFTVQPLKP